MDKKEEKGSLPIAIRACISFGIAMKVLQLQIVHGFSFYSVAAIMLWYYAGIDAVELKKIINN